MTRIRFLRCFSLVVVRAIRWIAHESAGQVAAFMFDAFHAIAPRRPPLLLGARFAQIFGICLDETLRVNARREMIAQ